MANRIYQEPQINLSPDNQPKLFVSMESFFGFSFWLAEELTDLVANYELLEKRNKLRNAIVNTPRSTQPTLPPTQA